MFGTNKTVEMTPNSGNCEASSNTNPVNSTNPKNVQYSVQDSLQMQEFVYNLKQVLHNPNAGIRQDLVNVMHELMKFHTPVSKINYSN